MYQTISCENYKKLGKRIFQALGFSEEESIQITEVLLYADLFGVESHGISRIQKYYRLLKEGIVNKAAVPEKIFETPISAVYDAKSAMGQIVSVNAMKEAIKMAKEHGVGMVEVKNSNHYGIAGYYALMAARQGVIGVSMTNTVPIMVPTFSAEAMLGSNPIAIAVPAGKYPFLYDGATTVITRGKVELYQKLGEKLPGHWAVNSQGEISYDTAEILQCINERKGGGILPVGGEGEAQAGYKGYGYAMIAEIMTSVLSGGASSIHKTDQGDTSHCFYAVDMGLFGNPDAIRSRLQTLMDELHSSRKAVGQKCIYVPGEKEFSKAEERSRNGIPVNGKTIEELNEIAGAVGIEGVCMQ